ncbi:prolyl oligopeptidase family serine peptidase [Priestia megaterium]|uniref:alpha/beta hydrolase family protein n=1 Tax=Priestia TaxID=2800373 RepID=UPI0025A3E20A|nr:MULTISPECIES: prolyl oligopeptidase family serine peptidase [Priestia]MED5121757.1 prolyl oligopeptidase family serine peptidase [Priestia megaterium]WJN47619.1 prolyl oligopeptidase family serine peptidase [Priestia aryabhattai]
MAGVYPEAVFNGADPLYQPGQVGYYYMHFGGSPEEYPDRYQRITSENLVDKEHTPPMLIIYGTSDHYVPVKSTRKFIKVLDEKGINYKSIEVPFAEHIFDMLGGSIGSQIYEQSSLKWFELYYK